MSEESGLETIKLPSHSVHKRRFSRTEYGLYGDLDDTRPLELMLLACGC